MWCSGSSNFCKSCVTEVENVNTEIKRATPPIPKSEMEQSLKDQQRKGTATAGGGNMGNAYSFRVNQHASSYDQMQIGGHSNVTGYQGGISMNAGSSTDGRMMFGSNANDIRHDERIARLQEIVNDYLS